MVLNYSDPSIRVFFPHEFLYMCYNLQFLIVLRMNWTAVSVFTSPEQLTNIGIIWSLYIK